jgi:hypothetical protein
MSKWRKPKEVSSIWDKPDTIDRYTVCFNRRYFPKDWHWQYLAVNETPFSPNQGFSQWGEMKQAPGPYLGKRIKWEDLPEETQRAVRIRLRGF